MSNLQDLAQRAFRNGQDNRRHEGADLYAANEKAHAQRLARVVTQALSSQLSFASLEAVRLALALVEGGLDGMQTVALCPNCHRRAQTCKPGICEALVCVPCGWSDVDGPAPVTAEIPEEEA